MISTDNVHAFPLFLLCVLLAVPVAMLCVKWGELIENIPILDAWLYGNHIYREKQQ